MPQFDMILLTPQQAEGADILEHTAGKPVREGGGDETRVSGDVSRRARRSEVEIGGGGALRQTRAYARGVRRRRAGERVGAEVSFVARDVVEASGG